MLDFARRINTQETFLPEEYHASLVFEAWETEDGSNEVGWDIEVLDRHLGVVVLIRYNATDGTLTTRARPRLKARG